MAGGNPAARPADEALGSPASGRKGSSVALLTTASLNGDFNNFSGTDAVAAALEAFLGLDPGGIGDGFEGSAIRQTFAAAAGDTLRFDYQFLTTEGSVNDFAFVTLGGLTTLADTTGPFTPSAVTLDPVFFDPTTETAWRTFTVTIAASGTYTLGLGVADRADEFIPSALAIDNGRLDPAGDSPPVAVPAPPGVVLPAAGLACLGGRRLLRGRRRC